MVELPADIRALCEVEKGGAAMPPSVKRRLAVRIAAIPVAIPVGWAAGEALRGSLGRRLLRILGHRASIAALSLAAGGGVGAKIESVVVRRQVAKANARPAAVAAAPAPKPTVPIPAAAPEVVPTPHGSPRLHVMAAPAPRAGDESRLAEERALLATARTALTRGDSEGALVAVSRHEAIFPDGELSEERESLRVQALVLAGRRVEAREAARRFTARWPKSLSAPVVRAAVAGGP